MNAAALLLIVAATLIALWRVRARGWRDPVFWLQPVAAALLAATLLPPALPVEVATLTVLAPGATPGQQHRLPWRAPIVALPGAAAPRRAEPVPDLATALRRHPQTRVLRILGNGLPPRDLDAVHGLPLQFEPAPEAGIVAVEAPSRVQLGRSLSIHGRVAAPAVRVALHDPAGMQVDVAPVDGDGGFRLSAVARAAGAVRFELRAVDARDALLDRASVPLLIDGGERLSVAWLAGTPDADAKYWRRWAQDAGLTVAYRADLTEGVALTSADAALTPDGLAARDLQVIDERAWARLGADEKAALLTAVDGGLGLILKATGPLEPAVAADWAALGFATTALEAPATVTLDRRLAMRERADFSAAPIVIAPTVALTPLLRSDDGALLAAWMARGAGRIALWRLLDSYRLVLGGDAARHGALWSEALSALSRPQPPPARGPQVPVDAWIDERAVICGLGAAASLQSPDGLTQVLAVRADGCAAAWPGAAGWHRLQTGAASWPLFIRAADDAAGLRAARDREATRRLETVSVDATPAVTLRQPLPRWPWFIAWLLVASLLWWRERRG